MSRLSLADGYCLWFMIRRLVVWHIVPRASKITNFKKNRFDFLTRWKKKSKAPKNLLLARIKNRIISPRFCSCHKNWMKNDWMDGRFDKQADRIKSIKNGRTRRINWTWHYGRPRVLQSTGSWTLIHFIWNLKFKKLFLNMCICSGRGRDQKFDKF